MKLQDFKDKIQQLRGQEQKVKEYIEKSTKLCKSYRRELRSAEKAQVLVQLVSKQTQEQLRYQLSELPRLALQSVFGEDAYDFEVDFQIKRSKVEVDFWFLRDGGRICPKDNAGLTWQ